MKKYFIFSGLVLSLILGSCGSGNAGIEKKKEELAKLKSEKKELESKITALEKEIGASDTSSNTNIKYVKTASVSPSEFSHYIDLMGNVDCDDNVLVNPKMGGLVTAVYVTEGQNVSAGQVLATVENSVLQNSVDEIENQLSLAKTIYEKQKRLWDQKIGTELQYLQAKNNKESLEKRLATTKTQLSLSMIVAPFAGVVDEVNIKVGETAAPGMGGIRVINMNKLKVVAKVADAYSGKIKKGDKVIVNLPDANINFESTVSYAGLNVAANSRTFEVEIKIPSNVKGLKPNMLAKISINDLTTNNALVIPLNTVQKSADGEAFVFLANNNKAELRTVKLGTSYNTQVVIESGLQAGETLIVEGYDDLIQGQELNIIK